MKNRQFIPVIVALLILCSMAFLYGCGSNTSSNGGSVGSPWIYVGASNDNAISIIDGSTNTLAGTIELSPRKPYHIAASPDGKHLYVSTDSPEVVVIDTATNKISGLITTDADTQSYGMAVSVNAALLYFSRFNDNKLVKSYLNSNPVTSETVVTAATPYGMSLAHNDGISIVCEPSNLECFDNSLFMSDASVSNLGSNLYTVAVNNGLAFVPRYATGDVAIVDVADIVNPTAEVTVSLITPESAATSFFGIVSIPGKNKLYVSQYKPAGTLNIIDASSTPTFESKVITGGAFTMSNPTYMTATADGKYVYVYDTSTIHHSQICVVDAAADQVVQTIPVNVGDDFDNNPVIIYK